MSLKVKIYRKLLSNIVNGCLVHSKIRNVKQTVFENKEKYDKHREAPCSPSRYCEYKCNICLLIMPNPSKLQAHLIEHTFFGCANFMCYICNAVFTVSTSLQQHILEHNNVIKPYICLKCKMQFFFRAELENHMYIHQSKPTHQDFESIDATSLSNSNNGDSKSNMEVGINKNLKDKYNENNKDKKISNGIRLKEEPLSSDDLT